MWNMINTLFLTKTFNKNELLRKKQNFFLYIFYTIQKNGIEQGGLNWIRLPGIAKLDQISELDWKMMYNENAQNRTFGYFNPN